MTSLRKLAVAGAASAVVALFATASQAAVTEFFDEASFLAAAGPTLLEDFNDPTLLPQLTITSANGSQGGGVWNDLVVPGGNTSNFAFAGGSTAFGGFWDETPGGFGTGLVFQLNLSGGGTVNAPTQMDGFSGQFYGFVSTDRFDSVTIVPGNTPTGSQETFSVDNVRFSGVVPEPGAWALMLVGFGGLGGAMRHRRGLAAAA